MTFAINLWRPVVPLICGLFLYAVPGRAAAFPINLLIQLGNTSGAVPEFYLGDSSSTTAVPLTINPYWVSGQSQEFQLLYTRPTNTMEIRLYPNGNPNTFASFDYNPTGGPAPLNAVWTLPAASFFATAQTGTGTAAISVSSLAITNPTGGALTMVKPLLTTTLGATNSGGATQTQREAQDVAFIGDANGSWLLTGFVTINYTGNANAADRVQFGISASAATPEPSSLFLLGTALAVFRVIRHRAP